MKHSRLLFTVVLAIAPHVCLAQQLAYYPPSAPVDNGTLANSPEKAVTPATAAKPAVKPLTARWLDLKTLSLSQRYRNTYDTGGYHLFEAGQQRSLIEGRVKLDAEGRYAVGFRASSGRYFNWAYSDYAGRDLTASVSNPVVFASFTPAQQEALFAAVAADPQDYNAFLATSSRGWEFYMRELYFSASPVKPVTVEFGSFGFERGLASEITTFDEDGYLSGERLRIHDPKHLFFDHVGYTNGFFGSIETPNLFDRGANLKNFNYRQVFADKQLNSRVGFSGQYTWQLGTDTLREATVVGAPELKVADKIRLEGYERVNTVSVQGLAVKGGSGFAIAVEKKVKGLSGDLGFASIDAKYGVYGGSRVLTVGSFGLNGDTYQEGKRPFTHLSYKINPVVTAFGFYTHAFGRSVFNDNQQGINAGLNLDLKALVNSEKLVF